MMKNGVLHLIDSGGFYGAEAVILNLCLGLKETDIKPVIGCFTITDNEKPELGVMAEEKGITVRYIPMRHKYDLRAVKYIYRIMDEEGIRILHSHGYKPSFFILLLYALYKTPYIITSHLWTKDTLRYYLYILLERFAMHYAQQVIAVSHPIAEEISGWRLNRRNVLVINNGIDIERYAENKGNVDSTKLRIDLGLRKDSRLIGTMGRLVDQKAQHLFLEAAREILNSRSDIEFLIVGEGPKRKFLQEYSDRLGLRENVHFLGFRSDAIQILKLLDIFVLSSIDEGLPIVILEAMSVGTPIVTSDVGEIPRVLENGLNGILFPREDVRSMTESILTLLDDPVFARKLGNSSRQLVKDRFSLSSMIKQYYIVYSNILKNKCLQKNKIA